MDPILVVSFPAVGDFVRSHSAVQLIAERHPGRPIDVVTSPIAAPLAALMPGVRRAFVLHKINGQLGFGKRRALAQELKAERYGTAYLLTSTAKAALVAWMAGIPERIGYPRDLQFGLLNRFPADWVGQILRNRARRKRFLDEVCEIATLGAEPAPESGWPAPRLVVSPDMVAAWRAANGIDRERKVLSLFTSGAGNPRTWPAERFVALAREHVARGWAVWIVGAARERPFALEICREVPDVVNYTATASIIEAMTQIAASTVFLGADGGLSHAAAALGVPTAVIFRRDFAYWDAPTNPGVRIVEPALATPKRFTGVEGVSDAAVREALWLLERENRIGA